MKITLMLFVCRQIVQFNYVQPLDLGFNKPVKDFMRGKFQELYANQVLQNNGNKSEGCTSAGPVQFPMSQMKPLRAQ